ncbi:MAG: DUF748 domain-containing protein [Opitutaceae bacterium]|nr:DUF748 domain-containing protein [Opitutaceae bacterium]
MQTPPRVRRRFLVAGVLVALFTITGFLILPPIVRTQLEQRLSAELGRTVTVEKVRLNPYTLSITLENFAIREPDGTALFVGWQRLYVNFDALSSLWGEWVLGDIALDGFRANVALRADHTMNFADILQRFTPPAGAPPAAPAKAARPLRIGRLEVKEAAVSFADATRAAPFATTLGPLSFAVTEFRTVSAPGAPYHFTAVTESGEKLRWNGTLHAEPYRSVGELVLEDIVLPKYAPYFADRIQADLTDGRLSVRGRYELNLDPQKQVMKLLDGALQLRRVQLRERASQELAVDLPAFDLTGVHADALTQQVSAAAIIFTGGHVRVRREADGTLNLLHMLSAPPAAAVAATSAAVPAAPVPAPVEAKLPDVRVGEIGLRDFKVEVADLAAPRPARLGLDAIQFSIKDVTLADGARMPMEVSLHWAPQGSVRMTGAVTIRPAVSAEVEVDVADFALLPLSPYLEQFINARITQGAVATKLAVQAEVPADSAPRVVVTGDVSVGQFGLVDGVHNEDLAGFGEFALRGIKATVGDTVALTLDEIAVAGPYARIIVNADRSLNLAGVAKAAAAPAAPAAAPAAPVAPAAPAPLPQVTIGRIVVSDGDYRFIDRSVTPVAQMAIGQFGGTVTGLSSTNLAKADVDLRASVDGVGPVAITGKLDPLGATPSVDLKIDARNVDLTPLSPYSGHYAGYELARGKLAVDVRFKLDGTTLDAANVVTLNQFTFGAPVESPDATKLPVRLAVALLKDLDGNIVIDLPVQGQTNDPSFRVGKVVVRVIVNLLTKAAVSPFALLGSMFGGGGDELGWQEFTPGTAELLATERPKLETLVKALGNRPGLSLDLEGAFDASADAYALKRVKLAERVRRSIWEAKHAADPNIPPPAQLAISPEEHAAKVKQLFDAQFPPGTEFGTPLPPPPTVVAPSPPPAGWFKRLVYAITFKAKRDQRAAEKENARLAAEREQAAAAAIAAGLPLEEMAGRLAETMSVSDEDLQALAQARARAVREYFVTTGGIAADRIFLAQAKAEAANAAGKGPRVFLNLQ